MACVRAFRALCFSVISISYFGERSASSGLVGAMRTSADGDLAASVLRQAEEERQYCMQKGRSVPSALSPVHSIHSVATASLEPNSPPAPVSVPSSVTDVKPTGYDMPLASLSPGYMQQQPSPHRSSSARSDDGLRGAGAIFLTRYSQRRTLSIGTPSGPHTSIPDREVRARMHASTPSCTHPRPVRARASPHPTTSHRAPGRRARVSTRVSRLVALRAR